MQNRVSNQEIQTASEEMNRILRETGAIVEDVHCVHISGLHLDMWLNKDAILPHVRQLEGLAARLARRTAHLEPEIVCAPAIGGLILAEWVAHHLGAMCAFAEHDPAPPAGTLRGSFLLRRGYDDLVLGRRVLVVDDCVTTGHSIIETIAAVRRAGGDVVGGASLIAVGSRSAESLGLDEFHSLLEFPEPPMWTPEECPLCRDGVPIYTRFGHGAEFLANQRPADRA